MPTSFGRRPNSIDAFSFGSSRSMTFSPVTSTGPLTIGVTRSAGQFPLFVICMSTRVQWFAWSPGFDVSRKRRGWRSFRICSTGAFALRQVRLGIAGIEALALRDLDVVDQGRELDLDLLARNLALLALEGFVQAELDLPHAFVLAFVERLFRFAQQQFRLVRVRA